MWDLSVSPASVTVSIRCMTFLGSLARLNGSLCSPGKELSRKFPGEVCRGL